MWKGKQLLIVLPVGCILAGTVVLAYLLDPSFITDFYRLTSMIIAVVWAFFLVPSILFAVAMGKRYFSKKSPQEAFRVGILAGALGYGGLFALCLLVSPVTGTMWYVFAIKEIASEKAKNASEQHSSDDDIFQI